MDKKMWKTFEYGKEQRKRWQIFQKSQGIFIKMPENNIIPVSLRLKSNIKTPRGLNIIRKTEKGLLNGRIKTINNTIERLECQKDTCILELSRVLDKEAMAECNRFMDKLKEDKHSKTLEWLRVKYDRYCMKIDHKDKGGCSKNENMLKYMHQSGTKI